MKEYCDSASENFSDPIEKTPTLKLLKEQASKHSMCILGSIPERGTDNRLYNTGIAIDAAG